MNADGSARAVALALIEIYGGGALAKARLVVNAYQARGDVASHRRWLAVMNSVEAAARGYVLAAKSETPARQWRDRAEEVRTLAEAMNDQGAVRDLLDVAERWETRARFYETGDLKTQG